jgi:cholesterol oxidase
MDGSLIPGSAGACNPSMTIAAVAERNLDKITHTDVGSVF